MVYKALDNATGKHVAIKFTFDMGNQEFQRAIDAFQRETQQNVFELNHPGIIKLLGMSEGPQVWIDFHGIARNVLFVVVELAEGGEFFDYVAIQYFKLKMPKEHPDFPFSP